MGMGLRLELGLYMRHEQRLELRMELREPGPPPGAVRGLHGMRVADEILKELGAIGILIGGVARALWNGNRVRSLASHKDVDVLILDLDCDHHPQQFAGGIDWWIRHGPFELPTNGNLGIYWPLMRDLRDQAPLPGLYLVPHEILLRGMTHELRMISGINDKIVPSRWLRRAWSLRDDPCVPPVFPGRLIFMPEEAGRAEHCWRYDA